MNTYKISVVLLGLQIFFILTSCYELVSYDTPQEAMKDATETEAIDRTSNDILVTGQNFKIYLKTMHLPQKRE